MTANIYSLSRIYADESISELANNLRIDDKDRNSFIHFIKISVSYVVSNRFKHNYPINMENVRDNYKYLDKISLMSVGLCISNAFNKIIETTMKMTRNISVNQVLTKDISSEYNIANNEKNEEDKNLGGKKNVMTTYST